MELRISKEYRASNGKIVVEHSALREVPARWKLVVSSHVREARENGPGFNGAETNCGIAHILGILVMISY